MGLGLGLGLGGVLVVVVVVFLGFRVTVLLFLTTTFFFGVGFTDVVLAGAVPAATTPGEVDAAGSTTGPTVEAAAPGDAVTVLVSGPRCRARRPLSMVFPAPLIA